MKEPFVPKSTICQMLPLSLRREFFRRICPPSWGELRRATHTGKLTINDVMSAYLKLNTPGNLQ